MAADALETIRKEIGLRVAEIRSAAARLSPLDVHQKMDAIRQLAALNGLGALELLARSSAQRALLPGRRVALHSCLDRMMDALDCRSPADSTAILAAVAVRLH